MKIIVCGGGQVGTGIARQLAGEGNDVTILDPNPQVIAKINDTLDVSAIRGVPSHPTVLEEAGAVLVSGTTPCDIDLSPEKLDKQSIIDLIV